MGKRKTEQAEPTSWIVCVRRTIICDICVDNCTEEQARSDPWQFSVAENETEQDDWTVLSIKPNV